MQIHRMERGEASEIVGFLDRVERETGTPPLGESKFVDLRGPLTGAGFVLTEGDIRAYLHVLRHDSTGVTEMELAALPPVDPVALRALVEAAGELVDDRMLWWTFGDSEVGRFATAAFPTVRELQKLARSLPPPVPSVLPTGVEVRPFRVGRDEDRWLEVNNEAFAGHPENGGWNRRDLAARQEREWFSPEGFRMAWAGEELAGFCWTKVHRPRVGEIYVIAVAPAFQGRGLARAIVVEALWYLVELGCGTGMLYVDAANGSALRLYQSLGFRVERVDRCVEVPKAWPQEAQ